MSQNGRPKVTKIFDNIFGWYERLLFEIQSQKCIPILEIWFSSKPMINYWLKRFIVLENILNVSAFVELKNVLPLELHSLDIDVSLGF